jgi:AraC-like DNA-binding protein
MTKELFLSTDMVDAEIRDNFWRDAIKLFYEVSSLNDENEKGFIGTLRSFPFANMLFGSTTFNSQHYERTANIIAQSGLDHYVLQAMLAGTMTGNFNGVAVSAKPGDIFILDMAQVVSSQAEAGARLTVIMPRQEVEKIVGRRNLHGMVLKAEAPTTQLLFEYLRGLNDVVQELSTMEAVAAKDAMLAVLTACIKGANKGPVENVAINLPIRNRILAYIDNNITNPLLGPHSIQQHFRMSRSHLYRAFEPDEGVAKVIRDKRLDLAYRIVIDKTVKAISLKEVAYRCGFHDATQLTKAFKARFGLTPKEAREAQALTSFQGDGDTLNIHEHLSLQAKKAGIL